MSVRLQAGQPYSFVFRFDFELDFVKQVGGNVEQMQEAVKLFTAAQGNWEALKIEVAEGWTPGDDTLFCSGVFRPVAAIDTGEAAVISISTSATWYGLSNTPVIGEPANSLNAMLQNGLNTYYSTLRHGDVSYELEESYLTDRCFFQFRGYTPVLGWPSIIDEGSIVISQTVQQATPGSNAFDNIFSAATTIHSTDPNRNGRTFAGTTVGDSSVPIWLVIIGGVAAGLVGLVAVGYGARGIAQLAEEAK